MTEKAIEEITKPTPKGGNKLVSLLMKTMKVVIIFAIFMGISLMFAQLAEIHGKDIPADYFLGGYPTLIGLLDSEMFMGIIFLVTLSVIVYVIWLLWELHEVAVHKAHAVSSQQVQIVFALSLCGLFIDKTWWVLAIVIAFTRWDVIADGISKIIKNGQSGDKK